MKVAVRERRSLRNLGISRRPNRFIIQLISLQPYRFCQNLFSPFYNSSFGLYHQSIVYLFLDHLEGHYPKNLSWTTEDLIIISVAVDPLCYIQEARVFG